MIVAVYHRIGKARVASDAAKSCLIGIGGDICAVDGRQGAVEFDVHAVA
jgi:hypothetical protein